MLKALSTRLLQHLISQNSWASNLLKPFAGKSIQINVSFVSTSLVILENGNLAIAGETNISDATVTIPPSLLLRLLAKDEAANRQINIEGDTHLAAELAKVLSNMRWDYEDDISNLIGDIPANKIGTFARDTANSVKETGINLAEMLSEYWQEEMPLIAKKRHVEQFNAEVDTLGSDVARFEKKLAKLTKSIKADLDNSL
ncbi:SCP2 sterol-binding domain-containing protein [Methylotenera sp.]|uniref:ubiquinone biosynthesis accessory factor UbiJ n=1 Tax=Methylotenera sp. TaxID=2051956 RepID=UPI002487DD94|nr:SCP2 sterol-binding domain-containing protein [Methylotenera sp.]MDI1297835.1 SCP2 sterol-binding domain-containing protein [Methylotenera sp.]